MSNDSGAELYDISAVSRLTGLSTPNLRVWEKRYGVVEPARTESQRRLYTPEDIRRLTLLKNLVDRGHSIGSIAGLSIERLEARLQEQAAKGRSTGALGSRTRKCRLVLVGNQTSELLGGKGGALEGIRVVKEIEDLESASEKLDGVVADVLVIECPTLFPETVAAIQKLIDVVQAVRAIVIYRFAQSKTAGMVDKDIEKITAMRGPVDIAELRLALQADTAISHRGEVDETADAEGEEEIAEAEVEARIYSDSQLAKLTKMVSTIDCECPQHLANLLFALTAFEKYSSECESRSPKDAELHASLHRTTARARRMMEEALRDVLSAEGVTVL